VVHVFDLYCPFPSAVHPQTARAAERTRAWAAAFGLLRSSDARAQLASERFTWLVGRFFPLAPLPALQLISDFTTWLFWHDDVCDETALGQQPQALAATFQRLFGVLCGSEPPLSGQAFELSLAEMSGRFQRLAPDAGWMLRALTSVREYFDACVWEAQNRVDGQVPSINSFIPLRRCAGGMWIYLDFIELCSGRSLPLVLRKHREVQRLVQITNNVASWHNDLFSLAKEMRRGDVHNLVTAVQAQQGLDLPAAIQPTPRCGRFWRWRSSWRGWQHLQELSWTNT
jgi:hypothetical protein